MPKHILLGGPYSPPKCKVGDHLNDEIHGLVEVGGWTDKPISWPRRKKNGRPSLILCGDLVEAIKKESVTAIRYHFGVGATTVWAWRKALDAGRITDGTRKLLQDYTGVPPEAAALGREIAKSAESIAKMSETKKGKKAHPKTRKALLDAASKPKPEGWGEKANKWMLEGKNKKPSGV